MKKRKIKRDYKSVLLHLLLLLIFVIFNFVEKSSGVFSVAVLATSITLGASIFITPLLFLFSFVLVGKMGMLASMAIAVGVILLAIFIYKGFENKPKYELPLIVALSLVGYAVLGDTTNDSTLKFRIILSVVVAIFSLFTYISGRAVKEKGLKVKMRFEESLCVALSVVFFGLGVCNLTLPLVWKGIAVFVILLSSYLFKTGITTVVSACLGVSVALYFGDISYIALYLLFGIISEGVTKFSRYFSAAVVAVSEYLAFLLFSVYSSYSLADFLVTFGACVVFCSLPTKFIKRLKEKLYTFREKQLERQAINRNRLMVSSTLFEVASVFNEMANAFTLFRKSAPSEKVAITTIDKELKKSVCAKCANREKCFRTCFNGGSPFIPLISIGVAKGKVSFIDLPKELNGCVLPSDIIYCLNKLLSDYKAVLNNSQSVCAGRELIAEQALGVAEVLRSLATECGSLLKYQNRTERVLTDKLIKAGLSICELLIYGEGQNSVVAIITDMKEIPVDRIEKIIFDTFGFKLSLTEKAVVTDDKIFISFTKTADYDAVFGLSHLKKEGSEISGDTHSVIRIPNDKFLVALSDGMGSGRDAERVSSTSLSLIESFYRAGLSSPLILKTVNKLLSVNTEDTFTALDISIIDLKTLSADFIKYGSPYGFIVGKDGIKIVEGNSLPLGILEELKPAVCHTTLDEGDMLLLLTDGISDAFGSSSRVIDYLRSMPNKNPQTLTDGILEKAVSLSGEKSDDMTALAVRIFKKDA